MTNITESDLTGEWKTSEGVKLYIDSCIEIPAQKVWKARLSDGKEIYFTTEGRPMFHPEVGELVEKRRGSEDLW